MLFLYNRCFIETSIFFSHINKMKVFLFLFFWERLHENVTTIQFTKFYGLVSFKKTVIWENKMQCYGIYWSRKGLTITYRIKQQLLDIRQGKVTHKLPQSFIIVSWWNSWVIYTWISLYIYMHSINWFDFIFQIVSFYPLYKTENEICIKYVFSLEIFLINWGFYWKI